MLTVPFFAAVLAAVVFVPLGVGKFVAAAPMRQRADHLGYSVPLFRLLGLLEIAGGVGLFAGLSESAVGYMAAAGLLLLLAGAVVSHLRVGDSPAAATPAFGAAVVVLGYTIALAAS